MSEKAKIMNRIVRWFCFTVIFSFIPLGAYFVVCEFFGVNSGNNNAVGELLFSCIMISAESLCTLVKYESDKRQALKDILLTVALITIVIPAFLYGGMLLDKSGNILNPNVIPAIFLGSSIISGLATQIWTSEV